MIITITYMHGNDNNNNNKYNNIVELTGLSGSSSTSVICGVLRPHPLTTYQWPYLTIINQNYFTKRDRNIQR